MKSAPKINPFPTALSALHSVHETCFVMAGLVPATHPYRCGSCSWMAGTGPATTSGAFRACVRLRATRGYSDFDCSFAREPQQLVCWGMEEGGPYPPYFSNECFVRVRFRRRSRSAGGGSVHFFDKQNEQFGCAAKGLSSRRGRGEGAASVNSTVKIVRPYGIGGLDLELSWTIRAHDHEAAILLAGAKHTIYGADQRRAWA
jgi:hypothetical protein